MSVQHRLARPLGWFSLALGVPHTFTPERLVRLLGVRDDGKARMWSRVVGLRELAAGAGLTTTRRPAGWLWGRVAGDAMDWTLLATAMRSKPARPDRILAAMGALAGITVVDVLGALRLARSGRAPQELAHVSGTVTVRRPREDVFRFWSDLERLPTFMRHLDSVAVITEGRSRWRASTAGGGTVEWDAELIESVPDELIAWQSLQGSEVENAGAVRFVTAPGDRGTEIHLDMRYAAPAGAVGEAVATLLGENPRQQVRDDLRRFKQMAETGEIIRSEGTPEGTNAARLLHQRPAQPLPVGSGDGRR